MNEIISGVFSFYPEFNANPYYHRRFKIEDTVDGVSVLDWIIVCSSYSTGLPYDADTEYDLGFFAKKQMFYREWLEGTDEPDTWTECPYENTADGVRWFIGDFTYNITIGIIPDPNMMEILTYGIPPFSGCGTQGIPLYDQFTSPNKIAAYAWLNNPDPDDLSNYDDVLKYQKCCAWTCYKDGTTYYLTWNSPYIETDPGFNGVFPSDVSVKYQFEWKAGIGAATQSEVFTLPFTSEPLQFNTKGIMEKSSPNKFYTVLAQIMDIAQWISIDDYLKITFNLEWKEWDTGSGSSNTVTTDECYIKFNSQTLAWFFNGNQKDKSISDCVIDYSAMVDDGSTVTLKDGYFADDPDYSGPGDGTDPGYDDPTVPSDTLSSTTPYGNNNILTTTYAMTAPRLASLAAYLWGGVFETTIQKINNSPLENIVSLRCFPFDLSGTDQEIILGNAATGVNGAKVADNYNATFSVGSVTVEGYYGSFLDYEPYTSLKIFLPFIGLKDIDLNYCMGKSLSVEYVVDLATGTGSCNIYVDSVITYTYACNIGFDIPLSSTNSAQVAGNILNNLASSAVVLAAEAASENYVAMAGTLVQAGVKAATAKRSTQTTGSFSANVWGRMPRTCYLVYDRPTYQNISLFNHTYGRMCNQSKVIGTLSGYTQVNNLDLSGIAIMTQEEEDIIRQMFAEGIFV